MQLYILNPKYEKDGYIDATESTLWLKKYNDVGQCEIYIPCSDEMLATLKKGNYVFRFEDDMFCKIETVEITTDAEQGDYIIATANDAVKILAGRCIAKTVTHSGSLASFVYRLIDENVINPTDATRKIDNFVFDTSNFAELTDTIETTTAADKDLLQTIMTACNSVNYGFGLSYDIEAGQLVFRLKKGKNKATIQSENYVEFSPDFSNILSSRYKEDESNYKNVACVTYANDKGKNSILYVYFDEQEPSGEARKELFVDGTGINREVTHAEIMEMYPDAEQNSGTHKYVLNGVTIANYTVDTNGMTITLTDNGLMPILQDAGKQALSERKNTKEFNGNVDVVDTYEYKTDYDLGDVVKVINEYGIEAEARIIEVMESEDNENGYTVEPKFEYIN